MEVGLAGCRVWLVNIPGSGAVSLAGWIIVRASSLAAARGRLRFQTRASLLGDAGVGTRESRSSTPTATTTTTTTMATTTAAAAAAAAALNLVNVRPTPVPGNMEESTRDADSLADRMLPWFGRPGTPF